MLPDAAVEHLSAPEKADRRPRRWLAAVGWVLAAAAGVVVYTRLGQTMPVNSDGSSQALQAWDLLHGNLLLRHWETTDVSFYTTEIPEYALVEVTRGLGQDVVHVAAAVTYALAVLLAAALAKGTATGRQAVFRVLMAAGIMLAPQLASGTNTLLLSPDHMGTSVPVMAAWLILDQAPRRWWVPVVTSALLAWATIADALVLVVAIVPAIVVCAVRVVQALAGHRRDGQREVPWFEIWLGGGAIAAAAVGEAVPRVIGALGGFQVRPLDSSLAPLHDVFSGNLPIVSKGFLLLGGAYLPGPPAGVQDWFTALHLVGIALAACAIAVTAWRFFRGEDLVPQLLLAGVAVNVAAYLFGTHAVSLSNAREMAPVLPFAAALAGRQLPGLLSARVTVRRVAVPVLGLVLAGYVAGLARELTAPVAPPQNAQLTAWLTRHHLGGTGLSGYWQANVVTLTSGERAAVRSVVVSDGKVIPYHANLRRDWYDPSVSYADFVVLGPHLPGYTPGIGYPGFTDLNAVRATFGHPARTYHVGPYTILWWHKNLLADMR